MTTVRSLLGSRHLCFSVARLGLHCSVTRTFVFFEQEENLAAGLLKRLRPQQGLQPRVTLRLFAVNLF